MMKKIVMAGGVMLALAGSVARAADAPIKIGVGTIGPISVQTESDIQRLVGTLPNVKAVPIQPPGGVEACVKRFVAGDADDRLDAVMVVSLPIDSFKAERDAKEARFTGAYEIWTLNLSTLAEDRHRFDFTDSETIVSGTSAILTIPAQFLFERASGQKLISSNTWQAYEAVQIRVEAKLLAATKIYLTAAPIRETQPLNRMECAQHLLDRGDGDTAMLVFNSIGISNPDVQRMIAAAQEQLKHGHAQALLGRTLGAMAGGDASAAGTILAAYEKEPAADLARVPPIRTALGASQDHRADTAYNQVLRTDVPGLDHAALVAMMTQLFSEETGAAPNEVIITSSDVTIEDAKAGEGLKTHLDGYAAALGKAARMMSLKCGCAANAALTTEAAGGALLKAKFAPSFTRPEVGLP